MADTGLNKKENKMNEKMSKEILNELKHINMNLQTLTQVIKDQNKDAENRQVEEDYGK